MPSNSARSAHTSADVHQPAGPIARIRAPWPGDAQAVQPVLALPEATRVGAARGEEIPTLVMTGTDGGEDFEHVLTAALGAVRRPDESVELATHEWPTALASFEHGSDPVLGAEDPRPAIAPQISPQTPDGRVVIVGGGVAALECLMALRDLGGPDLRIRLVAADDAFTYRPLQVVEPFSLGTAQRFPLFRIVEDFGAELVIDTVVEVRAERRQAICASGAALDYDALVLAPGAQREPAYEHAITFGADPYHGALHELLIDLADGRLKDVAFVIPPDIAWSLPLYELALMTAQELSQRGIQDVAFSLVTPEQRPLAIFGPQVSGAVSGLLDAASVEFIGSSYADVRRGVIRLEPGGRRLEIDAAVALPVLRGPTIAGVPADRAGFIPTDRFGAVIGLPGMFAAGDATSFPVKQGGLAAQQADAVAESVAAALGASITPRPFKPVLRGLLFTGDGDRFLRTGIGGGEGDGTSAHAALWWPPNKIAGLYLAPYLYRQAGWAERKPRRGFQEVEVSLEHVAESVGALKGPRRSGSGSAAGA